MYEKRVKIISKTKTRYHFSKQFFMSSNRLRTIELRKTPSLWEHTYSLRLGKNYSRTFVQV